MKSKTHYWFEPGASPIRSAREFLCACGPLISGISMRDLAYSCACDADLPQWGEDLAFSFREAMRALHGRLVLLVILSSLVTVGVMGAPFSILDAIEAFGWRSANAAETEVVALEPPDDPFAEARTLDAIREAFFEARVPYGTLIHREAMRQDLSPELVAAVVRAESAFKPHLVSIQDAHGLMQLIPETGQRMGARDLFNPTENVRAGTRYLRFLHDRFDGDQTKAIAAYNAGEGNVDRYDGVPPFRETRNYVRKVDKYESMFEVRVERFARKWERLRFDLDS